MSMSAIIPFNQTYTITKYKKKMKTNVRVRIMVKYVN